MEVKFEEEDKAITFLCSFPKSWDHFVTSINLSTTESLKFGSVVGALLFEEVQRKSSIKTYMPEAMVAKGQSRERGEKSKKFFQIKVKRGTKSSSLILLVLLKLILLVHFFFVLGPIFYLEVPLMREPSSIEKKNDEAQ